MSSLQCSKCGDTTMTSHVHLKPCNYLVCFACMVDICWFNDTRGGLRCLNGDCNEPVIGFEVLQSLPSMDRDERNYIFGENKRPKFERCTTAFECERCKDRYDSCKITLEGCNRDVCVACLLHHIWDNDKGDRLLCCAPGCNIRTHGLLRLHTSGKEVSATNCEVTREKIPIGKMKMQDSDEKEVWVNTDLLALYPSCRLQFGIKNHHEFPHNTSRFNYIESELTGSPEYAKVVLQGSRIPLLLQEEIRLGLDCDPNVVELLARQYPEGLLQRDYKFLPIFLFDVLECCPSILLDVSKAHPEVLSQCNGLNETPLLWYLRHCVQRNRSFNEDIVSAIIGAYPSALHDFKQGNNVRFYPLHYACWCLDVSPDDGGRVLTPLFQRLIDGSPPEAFQSNYCGTPLLRLCERVQQRGGFNANTASAIHYLANKAPQAIGIRCFKEWEDNNSNGPLPIHYITMERDSPVHRLSLIQIFYRLYPETLNAGPAESSFRQCPSPRSNPLVAAAIPLLAHAEALRKQISHQANVAVGNLLVRHENSFMAEWGSIFRDYSLLDLKVANEAVGRLAVVQPNMTGIEARLRQLCVMHGGNGDAFYMM